jgi:hypothetical protein
MHDILSAPSIAFAIVTMGARCTCTPVGSGTMRVYSTVLAHTSQGECATGRLGLAMSARRNETQLTGVTQN